MELTQDTSALYFSTSAMRCALRVYKIWKVRRIRMITPFKISLNNLMKLTDGLKMFFIGPYLSQILGSCRIQVLGYKFPVLFSFCTSYFHFSFSFLFCASRLRFQFSWLSAHIEVCFQLFHMMGDKRRSIVSLHILHNSSLNVTSENN